MIATIEHFISSSQSVFTPESLRELYLEAIEDEGYQNAVFARTRDGRLVDIPWTRFPEGYADCYVANQWDKLDPVVHFVRLARCPFSWEDVCARMNLSADQKRFLAACRDMGVHSGVTVPLHGPGTDIDLISLSLRDEKRAPEGRMATIYGLSFQYRIRLSEITDECAKPRSELTSKEVECLQWCKEGKTNWEIGEILSISEKTVEFHVSNTIRKLGVSNRITAVVKAIQIGIISI
ncbi:LuxR C-terminal-related transcriptional regulator [Bradyrhizobium sp. CB1717]|uniref:helix-turn-helix transcriptional regulator n=1 Tax=Bradyrhizobium sp. CB1717 TaxID=3039154 RepID=UPI0024B1A9CF|nr:LuxR family transcriptional regulator [Bradyrhizobium sp. CB1717]WFU26754.1 LuxR C-terminal-related transcriptional regulator [Bradyrhizobium sp. CB1717]